MAGSLLAEAFVEISSNTKPLVAGLAAAKTAVMGFGAGMTAALGPVALLIGGALAVKNMVGELIDGETQANNISSALRATGQEVEANTSKFTAFADNLEKITTVSADTTNAMIAVGLNMGIPAEQMEVATKSAIGLAKAYGIDATSAMEMLAKEQQGVTSALSRAIPALNGVEGTSKRLAIINEAAARGFQQEQESLGTLGGAFSQMGNLMNTLAGDIGSVLGPALHVGIDALAGMIDWMKDVWKTTTGFIEAVGMFSSVGGIFETVKGMVGSAMSAIGGFIMESIFVILNADLAIQELAIIFGEAYASIVDRSAWAWEQIGIGANWLLAEFPNICMTAMDAVITIFTNYGSNVATVFSSIWENVVIGVEWFSGNFGDIFTTVFDYYITYLSNFGENVKNIFKSIWNFIASGGSWETPVIKGVLEGAKNSIKSLPQFKKMPELKDLMEGSVNSIGSKPEFTDFKESDFGDQKEELRKKWDERRGLWEKAKEDDPLDDGLGESGKLTKLKDSKKEGKTKKDGDAGKFAGLGDAFKRANEMTIKSMEKKEKEKESKKTEDLQKKQIEAQNETNTILKDRLAPAGLT